MESDASISARYHDEQDRVAANELPTDSYTMLNAEVSSRLLSDKLFVFLRGTNLGDEDARTRTVRAMESRYHVDGQQADRVELTAMALLDQVAKDWKLDLPVCRRLLGWASRQN